MARSARNAKLEAQVIEALEAGPSEGLSQDDLKQQLAVESTDVLSSSINKLLSAGRLVMLQYRGNKEPLFVLQKQENALKLKGLSSDDHLVFQSIKEANDKGIWTKDLKYRTNLPAPVMNKALKELEKRKLVKAIKSVANQNRKVYMLYELEPAREVSGGAWYDNLEFDSEFIEVLRKAIHEFVRRQGNASLDDIAHYIRSKKLAKIELRNEDVLSVINTLEYEGEIEEVDIDEIPYWHISTMSRRETSYTAMPCGICPVFNECTPGGHISPETCKYFEKWLEF